MKILNNILFAGILDQITKAFGANNSQMGLLQTAFIISYMIFAPLFGYLGKNFLRQDNEKKSSFFYYKKYLPSEVFSLF